MRFIAVITAFAALCPAPAAAQYVAARFYDDHRHDDPASGDPDDHHHDGRHDYFFHDDHGHGGQDHVDFDYLEPFETHARGVEGEHGHSGHTSPEGYPYVHGIRTEIDFIERALELDLVPSRGADGGFVDELEFEAELVWAINNRTVIIVGIPWISLDPLVEPNTSGAGDMDLGIQFLAFNGEWSLFFLGLGATVPTGDAGRDLGAGNAALEPYALFLYDFGGGNYFQSRFSWEIPISTTGVAGEFRYDLGMYHSIIPSANWRRFKFLTPAIELNGITALNEAEGGQTVLDMTTGVRWVVRETDEVGIGCGFPIMGRRNFDFQVLLSYRLHF